MPRRRTVRAKESNNDHDLHDAFGAGNCRPQRGAPFRHRSGAPDCRRFVPGGGDRGSGVHRLGGAKYPRHRLALRHRDLTAARLAEPAISNKKERPMSITQIAQSLHWQGWHRHGLHRYQRSDRGWIALVKIWWRRMQDRRTLAWTISRSATSASRDATPFTKPASRSGAP